LLLLLGDVLWLGWRRRGNSVELTSVELIGQVESVVKP
jgi:hypothetical protein